MPVFLPRGVPAGSAREPFPPFLAAYLEADGLAGEWRSALGLEARAAVARAPLPVDLLSREELACYRNLPDASRRPWLTGRAALRRLLDRLAPGSGAGAALLPPAGFSLAYSAGAAVAAACLDAPGTGLGVDLEADGRIDPGSAALILAREESEELASRTEDPFSAKAMGHWLRLRSVKSALFKADPDRRERNLGDYRVLAPALRRGKARLRPALGRREFRYVTHSFAGWRISLAAAPPMGPTGL